MARGTFGVLFAALSFASAVAASQESGVSRAPPPPDRFAAPQADRAGRVARRIAHLVPRFRNYRSEQVLGVWRLDERARWSVRSERECLDALDEIGIAVQPISTNATPIPTPVRLRGAIGGVVYRKRGGDPSAPRWGRDVIVSCELAARLPHLSEIVRAHGIHTIEVSSAWRREPAESFHRMGLALDINAFLHHGGEWRVEREYPADLTRPTCPPHASAPFLQQLACEIAASGRFSTTITPSYSPGHANHFHVDVRPDDPRVFVR